MDCREVGGLLAKNLKREFKYYRLTAAGKKQLIAEESKWKGLTRASRGSCGRLRRAEMRWWRRTKS